jgi:hypothetical protein
MRDNRHDIVKANVKPMRNFPTNRRYSRFTLGHEHQKSELMIQHLILMASMAIEVSISLRNF